MGMEVTTLSVQVKSDGIDQATKSLDNLGSQAERTEKAVDKLTSKLANTSSSFGAIKASLNELKTTMALSFPTDGANALNKAMMELSTTLSSIKSKNIKIDVGAKDLGRDTEVARKGVESLNQSLASGQNVMQMFGKELYHIRNLLGGTMLAGALINTSQAAIGMADAWTLMGAKLKMQVGSAYAAADAQQKLYVMAQQLRVPLQGVTQLFTRLVPAMNEYGYSTKDAMSVTQAMAAALKVSGATAAEASSVMLQFSQSMQAGRLNGAEFNAVAEGAPIILRLIGQEINKTRGELKKMGADGVISVELITEVLKKNKDALTKMSSSVPDTVESAFTNLTNALTKYIGEANNAVGVTGLIAAAIKLLADNLELVGNVAKYVAIAGFAAYSASLANAMVQMAIAPALSASLAAELGLVGVAATGAAGGVGLLDRALLFLAKNPVIIIFTLLATGAAYVYDKFKQAEEATKAFTNKLAELDKLKGAQAMQAYSSAIDDVLASLSKENDKLTELEEKRKKAYRFSDIMAYNDAIENQKKAVTSLAEQYGVLAQRQADVTSGEAVKRVSAKIKELQDEGKWVDYQISQGKKLKDIDKQIFETEQQIATAKDGFHKTNQEAILQELKAYKLKVDTLDDVDKASKKSSKEEESMAKKLEKSYLSALNSAQAFVEGQEEELGLKRKLTESEKEYEKVMRVVSDLKTKFRGADTNELENIATRIKKLGEEKRIRDELNKFLDKEQELKLQAIALDAQFADSQFKATQALKERIKLQQLAFMDVGQTPLGTQLDSKQNDQDRINFLQQQITLTAELIDLQVQKAYWEAYMANDSAGMARAEKAGEELQKRIDGYQNELKALKALLPLQDEYTKMLALTAKKDMLSTGRTPGQILADGFGEAGAAIAKMSDAYKTFGDDMAKVDKYVADQKKMLMDQGPQRPEDLAKVDKEVADKRIQINAQMYGSLAGAAKGFFSENSKGYQAMAKAEKAFRVIELAMAAKTALTKMALMGETLATYLFGVSAATAATEASVPKVLAAEGAKAQAAGATAVTEAAHMPGPMAFVGAAAMIALLAGIGVMLGGSSSTPNLSAQRQATQGTGSVFGDSSAKSESTTKALEMVAKNSEIALTYNAGMLASLKNIEASLVGVAKLVIRGGVQAQVGQAGGMGTVKSQIEVPNSVLKGALIVTNSIIGALFSVKKSVVDSGFLQAAQSLSEIMTSGLAVKGYTDIETKKKKFGKTKTSTETNLSDLSTELQDQLTKVVINIGDSISNAAKALGMNGDSFSEALNSFVVDIGRISIQGMDAKQIQETLTNVFSKLGDDTATAVLPGLTKFQNIGEGYFETLTRVATTVATVDGIFGQFGQTFNLTGIEAIDAKMKLVDLAGGLQELASKVTSFYDHFSTEAEKQANQTKIVTDQFAKLGLTMIDLKADDARIQFRDLVLSFKDSNQEVFTSLLNLEGVVDDLTPAFKKVATAAEIAEQKLSMNVELLNLQGDSLGAITLKRDAERKTIDATLLPLQEMIWKLGDLKSASHTAMAGLEKSITVEKTALKKSLDVKIKNINDLKTAENGRYEVERQAIQDSVDAQNAAIDASNKAKDKQVDNLKTQLEGLKDVRNNLKNLFDGIGDSIKTLTGSVDSLQIASYNAAKVQLDNALAMAKATGAMPDAEAFKGTLAALTGISNSGFGSSFDFAKEKLVSAGKLTDLQAITGAQLTTQDATVLAIENSIKAIEDSKQSANVSASAALKAAEDQHKLNIGKLDEEIGILNLQYETDIEYLDSILTEARKQQEIADGTYIETKGVKDAVNNFSGALISYISAKDAQTEAWVNQISAMALSTMPTLTAIADRASSENQELKGEIAAMREEAAAQNRAIAANTAKTAKVLSQWDGDGQPEVRNVA